MKPLPQSEVAVPLLLARPRPLPAPALRLLSDERLARLASAGDRAAFGVIFHRYHRELYRFCVSILHSAADAEDALQTTMLSALNALQGDTREIALRPWLYRIAHNESITLLRRRRRTDADAELPASARFDVEASAELHAELEELLGDLRELPERQRAALVMRELGGLEYCEIGAVLETSAAGAKQATYDARRALHDLAKGRAMECAVVCSAVSHGDGRALRGRAVRAHLRACEDCRDYRSAIASRQSKVAGLAPAMPSAAAAGLLDSVFASAGGAGFGGAGFFTGFGVSAALKSLTAVAAMVALGATLEVAGPGRERGSDRHIEAAPIPRSSGPASRSVAPGHRASRSHGAHPAPAAHGGPGRVRHSTGGHRHAREVPPSRGPANAGRSVAQVAPPMTPDAAAAAPAAPSRHDGPIRQLVTHSTDPVRQGVRVVTHVDVPSVPEVASALPVKVPPLPIHPKRRRAS